VNERERAEGRRGSRRRGNPLPTPEQSDRLDAAVARAKTEQAKRAAAEPNPLRDELDFACIGAPAGYRDRLVDRVMAVVEGHIAQARQDGMTEALDWAASNPGYWAQKVAAHVVAQFEGDAE
jgi:hypothetical protein